MKDTSTRAERIKQVRGMTGLSRRSFCLRHKISIGSMVSWETENKKMSKRTLGRLISAFRKSHIDASEDWILFGTPPGPSFIEPPKEEELLETSFPDLFTFKIQDNEHAPYLSWGDEVEGVFISPFDIDTEKSTLMALLTGEKWLIGNILRLDTTSLLVLSRPFEQTFLRKSTVIPIGAITKAAKILKIIKAT